MNVEDELRRLFSDDRLELPVRPDAEKILARGIGRRRKSRAAAVVSAGALTIAATLGLSVTLAGARGGHETLPGTQLPVSTAPITTGQPAPPSSASPSTPPNPSSATTAPPSTSKKPSASTGPSGKPSSGTSSSALPPSTSKVIGPNGWGRLRLGMSESDAVATGEFDPNEGSSGSPCHRYWLAGSAGGPVDISPTYGVAMISPDGAMKTPEGVGVGSTDAQVRAAYPDATFADYEFTVPVPGSSTAVYIMNTDPNEKIFSVRLQLRNTGC